MCLNGLFVPVSFELQYSYHSRICYSFFVFCLPKMMGYFKIQIIQVIFSNANKLFSDTSTVSLKLMPVFVTLGVMLEHTVLRNDSHEPSS